MALLDLADDPYRSAPAIEGAPGGATSAQARQRGRQATASPYAGQPTSTPSGSVWNPSGPLTGPDGQDIPWPTTPSPFTRPPQTAGRTNPSTQPTSGGQQPFDWAEIFRTIFGGGFGGTTPAAGGIRPPWDPSQPRPEMTDPSGWFRSLASQYGGAVTPESLRAMLPELNAAGYRVQNQERGDLRPRLYGPDGNTYDVGQWGQGWDWIARGQSGGGGMGGMFDNPLLQRYLDMGAFGIDELMKPQGIHPVLQQALDALMGIMNGRDAGYDAFSGIAGKRLAELEKPAYTDAQRALINTNFSEPIESQRSASKQQALERAGARGMGIGSGLLELDTRDIDKSFDQVLGEGRRNLATQEIGLNESRQQEAVSIGQALAALSGKDLPVKLSAASQLGGIGGNLQNEGINRLMQALGISGQMAQIPFQSLAAQQSLFNTINNQPVPQADPMSSMITALLALMQGGVGAGNQAAGNSSNFWASLFNALPGLFAAIPGRTPAPTGGASTRPRSVNT